MANPGHFSELLAKLGMLDPASRHKEHILNSSQCPLWIRAVPEVGGKSPLLKTPRALDIGHKLFELEFISGPPL